MENNKSQEIIDETQFFAAIEGKSPLFLGYYNHEDSFYTETNSLNPSKSIVFRNIKVQNRFTAEFSKTVKADFPVIIGTGTSFSEPLYLGNINFKDLTIIDGDFSKGVFFLKNCSVDVLTIRGGKFTNGIKIFGGKFRKLVIEGIPEFKDTFLINGGTFDKIEINVNSPISFKIEESIEIYNANLRIKELLFGGNFHKESRCLFFHDFLPKQLQFSNLVNEGKITFRNLTKLYSEDSINKTQKYKLDILNSSLGDTSFINCYLLDYTFKFQGSNISGMSIEGTTLPHMHKMKNDYHLHLLLFQLKKIYETRGNFIKAKEFHERVLFLQLLEPDIELTRKKDVYGQLKVLYEQAGNTSEALEYKARELDIYRSMIRKEKGKYGEKINLFLNHYSNYYGNNWGQSGLITIGINFLLFSVYCWSLGFRFGTNLQVFWNLFSYSFEFLNPFRKADFLKEAGVISEISNSGRIIDYLSRIIVAFFVYQTIQAFRKFGKKSN